MARKALLTMGHSDHVPATAVQALGSTHGLMVSFHSSLGMGLLFKTSFIQQLEQPREKR